MDLNWPCCSLICIGRRICVKKKIILHTTCTRHRWGVISVGSISSFLIISIDVPFIAFQNVTEFHSSWTCQIYPCIIHYRMLLVLILHQFSATHSWNTTRFYLKNSFPVKDLDVGWRKLSSFLENEKKKILSSHQHTLVKFMYSSNLFALWQRPKTHKEYFSALKLFFLQVIACFWILLNWTFFLFKSYLYKQDNIVSVENSFRIVWILCFYFVLGYFFNLKNVVIYVWMSMRTLGVF